MYTALLIIDIQNDYFPGGRMELEGSVEAAAQAAKVLSYFRESGLPVIFIQHVSLGSGATFFLPDTEGVEIHSSVSPRADEDVFRKHYPNSFRDTGLLDRLQGMSVKRIVICGMMTHMCVDATVRAAFDHGFECIILGNACATRSLSYQETTIPASHVHGAFIAALAAVYGTVKSVDDFLSAQ